jgi:AcrR family transcriptional regulator
VAEAAGYPSAVPRRPAPTTERLRPDRYRAAQTRIITATLPLFAEHGVSGTSLQMIADALGVTKAAVYHQFPSKDEIVLAVAEVELARLEVAIDAAEAETSSVRAREVLLTQVVDLAVARRRMASALQGDPVMIRLLGEHEPFRDLMTRLYTVLLGEEPGPASRVPAAMIAGAIGGAVANPLVDDIDDETLRTHLLRLARKLLDLPD